MMRNHYTEVVSKSLHLWASGGKAPDEEAELGLQAVFRTMKKLSYSDARMFAELYSKRIPFSQAVHQYSMIHGIPEEALWRRIREFEKKVAKEQGIL